MKILTAAAVFAACLPLAGQVATDLPKIGDIAYQHVFDKSGWGIKPPGCAKIEPDGRGSSCIAITAGGEGESGAVGNRDVLGNIAKSKGSTFMVSTGFPASFISRYKGYELQVELGVKGENPLPPLPWEGIRISVNFATSTTPYNHAYYNIMSGSFDWTEITYKIRVPSDVKDMSMDLGLISPSGKVYFDHVKMTVTDIPYTMKTPPKGAAYKGCSVPRLRGFVTGINDPGSETGKNTLGKIANDWNANVAKLWFRMNGSLTDLDASLEKWMKSVEKSIETARQNKIYIVLHIDIDKDWLIKEHGASELIYENPAYAEKFVESWKTIAKHFKGCKEIYAFELLNESCLRMPVSKDCSDYPALMERTAKAINELDPERSIIVQTEEWWGPRAFDKMRPIDAKNIIYAVHFYAPFAVSHQGVGAFQGGKTSWMAEAYPGVIDGLKWDKATLKRDLQPVLDFQKAYNVQIVVSEFSCVRWALGDSRRKLLKDMIDIYEEYGWDWMYHGYPEWHGWSPRLGNDPWDEKAPATPCSVEILLKEWFAKNQKPVFDKP